VPKDKFTDRLMIPIQDRLGKIVGFTGRVLPSDTTDRPKYLNSNESNWFKKSSILYGLNLAIESIRSLGFVIVVEGNMDAIAASRYGIDNTVASQGTAFGLEQLKQLAFYTKTIWIAFDNDNAGILSGHKLMVMAANHGFEIRRLLIPSQYKDLDEYLHSMEAVSFDFSQLQTQDYLDYLLALNLAQLQSTDRARQRKALMDIISVVEQLDPLSIEQFLPKLSQISQISVTTLQSLVNSKNNSKAVTTTTDPQELQEAGVTHKPSGNSTLKSYKNLLALVHGKLATAPVLENISSITNIVHYLDSDIQTVNDQELDFMLSNMDNYLHTELSQNRLLKELVFYFGQKIQVIMLDPQIVEQYNKILTNVR
jgi:DNA primase